MKIAGVYDFYLIPFFLPEETVRSLLPPHLKDALSREDMLKAGVEAKEGEHLCAVEIGKQCGTGPDVPLGAALLKQNFQEAKLEIPFLRYSPDKRSAPKALLYKHTVFFDSHLMSISSSLQTGLRSRKATFLPSNFPQGQSGEVDCMVEEAIHFASTGLSTPARWSDKIADGIVNGPWIGERTGSSVQRHTFNIPVSSSLRPRYQGRLRLWLSTFLEGGLEDWILLDEVEAIWFEKVPFTLTPDCES